MVFVYVAVPEKYYTPASALVLHDVSVSKVTLSGAPRPGWNATSHAPSTVVSAVSAVAGNVRSVDAGFRNTTNTVPQGSRCSGTVVRPFAMRNDAGSRRPVSAYQSSASLPVTRNVASTFSSRSLRLFTK